MKTLAEVSAVVGELRRFVTELPEQPSCMRQLTAADLAQAKALVGRGSHELGRTS